MFFGQRAEYVNEHIKSGMTVHVHGQLELDVATGGVPTYPRKADGVIVGALNFRADNIDIVAWPADKGAAPDGD